MVPDPVSNEDVRQRADLLVLTIAAVSIACSARAAPNAAAWTWRATPGRAPNAQRRSRRLSGSLLPFAHAGVWICTDAVLHARGGNPPALPKSCAGVPASQWCRDPSRAGPEGRRFPNRILSSPAGRICFRAAIPVKISLRGMGPWETLKVRAAGDRPRHRTHHVVTTRRWTTLRGASC